MERFLCLLAPPSHRMRLTVTDRHLVPQKSGRSIVVLPGVWTF